MSIHRTFPKEARLAYKGIVFTVYQWDQKMFDGSTAVFERATRSDVTQIIPIKDGKILLAREKQPDTDVFWGIFGGAIDDNEDPLTAAKRELSEETGLTSDQWNNFHVSHLEDKLFWNISYYIAHDCKHTGHAHQDPGEKIEIAEVSFEEFIDIVCSRDFRNYDLSLYLLRLWKEGKLEEFRKQLGV